VLAPCTFFLTRFDRRVTVSAPDQRGRRQILAVHAWSMCLPSSGNWPPATESGHALLGMLTGAHSPRAETLDEDDA